MKVGENYRNILKETFQNILNLVRLDLIIDFLLKEREKSNLPSIYFAIKELLKINIEIKNIGGENMEFNKNQKFAYACAKEIVKIFKKNNIEKKLDSYRQKLTSSLIFKDYKRTLDILMQLSNYSGVYFGFLYDFMENPSKNDDIIGMFILELNTENFENKVEK